MSRDERTQRAMLADLGVIVERERPARGSHTVLYCLGPQGQRFMFTLQRSLGDTHTIHNMRSRVRYLLAHLRP